jgi:hypothetical protein
LPGGLFILCPLVLCPLVAWGALAVSLLTSYELVASIGCFVGTVLRYSSYFNLLGNPAVQPRGEIMFCDKCGASLRADQRFCSRCGKEFAEPMLGYPQRNRVREHVRLLGIFWLALSALDGLMAVASYIVANTVFDMGAHPDRPAFLHPFLSLIATFVMVKAFAGFVAGWGLLHREPWARRAAVVLAFVSLFFNVPFGTALGIYTLWVLLPAASDVEYEREVRSANAA